MDDAGPLANGRRDRVVAGDERILERWAVGNRQLAGGQQPRVVEVVEAVLGHLSEQPGGPASGGGALLDDQEAVGASDRLEHGLEVIDLRTLRPLDLETVLDSVARTNRLLAVEEGPATGGWAAGLLGLIAERGLHDLDDAWLLTTEELPIPYSPTLEDPFIPGAAAIASAVRERAGIVHA